MILKRLEDIEGNEILARSVMTWDYQMILPEGAVFKKEYIERVYDLGVFEVYVKENDEDTHEIVILKSEIENSAKEKVKDILERHTYHNNQELAELSNTADNIITTILEEDQVIEKIFDIKDRSTDIYEHSINICSLSILTALRMGIEKNRIHDIGVGCLLHDLGLRYSTIDYTHREEESFNPQEMAEYRKHPVTAYSALQNEAWIPELSKTIILHHHERMDGTGFPLHLCELPLECHIVNICDAFDEMICGITRKKIKVYEAIEYLKNFRDVKFDGRVVDTFLSFTAVYPAGTRVLTNEGELAVVISQNKDFQDRPVIRVLKDAEGNDVEQEKILDLVKVHNIFIDKVIN